MILTQTVLLTIAWIADEIFAFTIWFTDTQSQHLFRIFISVNTLKSQHENIITQYHRGMEK